MAAQSVSISWSTQSIEYRTTEEGYLSVDMNDPRSVTLAETGAPELPWVALQVPIEHGQKIASWRFEPAGSEVVAQSVTPAPARLDRPYSLGGPEAVEPDPQFYAAAAAFPQEQIRFAGVQSRRGQVAATFLVSPFSWDPVSRNLSFVQGGQVTFEVESAQTDFLGPPLRDAKISAETGARAAEGQGTVLQLELAGVGSGTPSLEGDPVQFLLITAEEFAPTFQAIVDWKNRSGTPAAIRTVEWIYENYPQGVDYAESVRYFIRDAYLYWGTESVVLAGDPDHVPVRYARDYSWNRADGGVDIVADQYFACLDGNWNANGNSTYGQAVVSNINAIGDQSDLGPDVLVGRISARSVEDAEIYTNKYLAYAVNPVEDDYYLKGLALAEVLFPTSWKIGHCDTCQECEVGTPCVSRDGADDAVAFRDSLLASPVGGNIVFEEMYERDYWWRDRGSPGALPLSRSGAVDIMNSGVNFIFHSGHGNEDRWAIGTDRVLASDLRGLTNAVDTPRYAGMVYAINCNSAAVDFDCAAEAWQFAPNGGGLVYIGASNLDFPHVAEQMQDDMFSQWPGDGFITPGEAYYNSTAAAAAALGDAESAIRFVFYSLIFLGDPDMQVWSDIPTSMNVQFVPSVQLGSESQAVLVTDGSGNPVEGAKVAYYVEGELLSVALVDGGGTALVPFAPTKEGDFLVTVTAPNKKPFQGSGSVGVGTATSFVSLDDFTVDDTTDSGLGIVGNGNGRIEVGETVAINLTYQNRGSLPITGLSAALSPADPTEGITVTVVDGSEDLSDLDVGASGSVENAFLVQVENGAGADRRRDEARLEFDLSWTTGSSVFSETISPNAYRPDLVAYETTTIEVVGDGDGVPRANETFTAQFDFLNMGSGTASGLQVRLQPLIANRITMTPADGIMPLTEAAEAEHATTESIELLFNQSTGLEIAVFLEDARTDPPTRIWTRLFDVVAPQTPHALSFQGQRNNIVLQWAAPNDPELYSYRVYRSSELDGTYVPLGNGLVSVTSSVADSAFYSDEGLPPVTPYFYKVAAIDSSGNESSLTEPLAATTLNGFSPGWPVALGDLDGVAPTVEQLDGWGDFEVVAGAEAIYAFRSDGTDFHDGDDSPATIGRLSEATAGYIFHCKPAVVDIDFPPDGEPEILTNSRFSEENGFRRSELVCLDRLGRVRFSQRLTTAINLSSPAVGDIDGDGDLEIVILGGSSCFAFHHDGTPVGENGGKILELPEESAWYLYSSVALANVAGDQALEIMFTARANLDSRPTRFYCFNGDGSAVPGFPYRYSTSGPGSDGSNASPAVVDITGDGYGEVFIASRRNLWMFDPNVTENGEPNWMFDIGFAASIELNPSPALGDLDRDGKWEVVIGGANGRLYVLDAETGVPYEPFTTSEKKPYLQITGQTAKLGSPIIGDLTGDEFPEVVIGDDGGDVFIFDSEGQQLPGYPYPIGGKVQSGLAMWDIDKNGDVELVVQPDGLLNLVVLDFPNTNFNHGEPDLGRYPWTQFRHDARNTGAIETSPITPLALQAPRIHAEGLSVTMEWTAEPGFISFEILRKQTREEEFEKIGSWRAGDLQVGINDYELVDRVSGPGTYIYQLVGVEPDGFQVRTLEQSIEVGADATKFMLARPQPNPFAGETSVQFALPAATDGTLRILDPSGRSVRVLEDGEMAAGTHTVAWDGRDDAGRQLGGGVYFVHLRASGQGERSVKLVRLR